MMSRKGAIVCGLVILIICVLLPFNVVDGKKLQKKAENKQLLLDYESRETSPPNFVRLLVMRLIYGIAAQMGVEERLAGVFNGAFVPPNADDADYEGGILEDIGAGDLGDDLLDF